MNQFDLVENWLNLVSYSRSQSIATEIQYKRVWAKFTSFINKTAEQIQQDYKSSDDRTFKIQYTQYIGAWIAQLAKEHKTNNSIKVMVGAVKSFFKYNNLPLGLVPQARCSIAYHNRDITKDEIVQIMAISKIREKVFFSVMAQSGLRPHTIRQLRMKNLESLEKSPCKIDVPKEITKGKYGSYVTFIGSDTTKYLRQYLTTRTNLTPDSLLFCAHDDPTKPVNVKDVSRAFRLAARKLEKTGALHFEIRKGKPSELRFYTLRKFFRKYANQMGFEHVNYMMGHTTRGSDSNYTPKDPEFYRDLYREKAMPFLRLETATPTETEKTIVELKKQLNERDKEIEELKASVTKIQKLTEFLNELDPEQMADFFQYRKQRNESLIEPFREAGGMTLVQKPSGTVLRVVMGDPPKTVAEIPNTETFKRKVEELGKKKRIVEMEELIRLSREASLEDETEAKKRRTTDSSKEG